MITKKNDWELGEWAFCVKAITPDGTTIEYDAPHVKPVSRGKKVWNQLSKAMGMPIAKEENSNE